MWIRGPKDSITLEKLRNSLSVTPENFCLTFKPAIPAKDDPCYGSWHGQPGSLRPGTSRFHSEVMRVTMGPRLVMSRAGRAKTCNITSA